MPDQQIQKGTIYANGNSVDATNLNAHVDNAILLPGAITAQTDATALNQADSLLMLQGGALCKGTVSQMKTAMSLGDYVTRSGTTNTGMVTSTQLTLGTTTQLAAFDAVSLGHLSANYLKNSAALQTLTGSLALTDYLTALNSVTAGNTAEAVKLTTAGINFLTTNQIMMLKRDPVEALEAAPKQYVDSFAIKAKAVFSGRYADATSIASGSYVSTSASLVTFTFSSINPFSIGNKFVANCTATSGTKPPITAIFIVQSVNNLTITAIPHAVVTAGSVGTFQILGCLIHESIGSNKIKNIIYCGVAANAAIYAVNFTDLVDVDLMIPLVSASVLTSDSSSVTGSGAGSTIKFDAGNDAASPIQITRLSPSDLTKTNSFMFNSTSDIGYRSGIVIY